MPVEFPDPIRFDEDDTHATYDRDQVHRCFCALRSVDAVFKEFRSRFTGKSSPVHFFWGAFDLAVTRFSGKPATPPPNADPVTRIGYNAELASLGFWPGGRWIDGSFTNDAVFFAYAFPEPEGYRTQPVSPTPAAYDTQMSEFVLPYEAVRIAPDPRAATPRIRAGHLRGRRTTDELAHCRPRAPRHPPRTRLRLTRSLRRGSGASGSRCGRRRGRRSVRPRRCRRDTRNVRAGGRRVRSNCAWVRVNA